MACENCKHSMIRERVGNEIETYCKIDGKLILRIIKCSEWTPREQEKDGKAKR